MYQNYIFDLYGTLVDIHTNEKKAYLWKKMSLFFGMKGAAYEPKELRMAAPFIPKNRLIFFQRYAFFSFVCISNRVPYK